jgi:hypothetical protein
MVTSSMPCLRSSIAAAIPPKPAPTINTRRLRCEEGDGRAGEVDMRLVLLIAVVVLSCQP